MNFQTLLSALALVAYVQAHEEPSTPYDNHPAEIARRQLETNKRHLRARNCAQQVAEYQRQRKAKRALRRDFDAEKREPKPDASATESAIAPHYSTIQNFTCVTAPELTEGPYYIRDDYVRQDLREGQKGVSLYMDIGVIDVATCLPVPDVFVELWACNAQGEYSSFVGSVLPTFSDFPQPTGTETYSFNFSDTSAFPIPTGGFSIPKTSTNNFLRGGYPTNENGMVEIITIYPGFYTGRTIHVHVMVHENITYNTNGTIVSASGPVRHIGQIFFDEENNAAIRADPAYQGSGHTYTSNAEDIYTEGGGAGGYNAYAEIEKLGETLADGVLGYITIGIDSSADYSILTSNKWDPNFVPAPSGTTAT